MLFLSKKPVKQIRLDNPELVRNTQLVLDFLRTQYLNLCLELIMNNQDKKLDVKDANSNAKELLPVSAKDLFSKCKPEPASKEFRSLVEDLRGQLTNIADILKDQQSKHANLEGLSLAMKEDLAVERAKIKFLCFASATIVGFIASAIITNILIDKKILPRESVLFIAFAFIAIVSLCSFLMLQNGTFDESIKTSPKAFAEWIENLAKEINHLESTASPATARQAVRKSCC